MVGLAVNNHAYTHASAYRDVNAVGYLTGAAPCGLPQSGGVNVGIKAGRNAQCVGEMPDDGTTTPAELGGGQDRPVCG